MLKLGSKLGIGKVAGVWNLVVTLFPKSLVLGFFGSNMIVKKGRAL